MHSTVSRLLVDLNRSENNPGIWSKYIKDADERVKKTILDEHYRPYRQRVFDCVASTIRVTGHAIHISVHTFTPRFRGDRRTVDIGILFDPDRQAESSLANLWLGGLQSELPRSRVRANQPYQGTDDGLTTWLRTQFAEQAYVGIEIEIANSVAKKSEPSQHRLMSAVSVALREAIKNCGNPRGPACSVRRM